jgi:hypothetical protein
MRLIVAGSRTFDDFKLLCKKLDALTAKAKKVILIHGGAPGADRLSEEWFRKRWKQDQEKFKTYEIHHPDYEKYPAKVAPIKRNSSMVRSAGEKGCLAAFWDGKSHGTRDIIMKARKAGLQVRVIIFGGNGDD